MMYESWKKEDDVLLAELVHSSEKLSWTNIQKIFNKNCRENRTAKTLKKRWDLIKSKTKIHQNWSFEEEIKLLENHKEIGNSWVKISKILQNKTSDQVKNHFYSILRKYIKRIPQSNGFKSNSLNLKESLKIFYVLCYLRGRFIMKEKSKFSNNSEKKIRELMTINFLETIKELKTFDSYIIEVLRQISNNHEVHEQTASELKKYIRNQDLKEEELNKITIFIKNISSNINSNRKFSYYEDKVDDSSKMVFKNQASSTKSTDNDEKKIPRCSQCNQSISIIDDIKNVFDEYTENFEIKNPFEDPFYENKSQLIKDNLSDSTNLSLSELKGNLQKVLINNIVNDYLLKSSLLEFDLDKFLSRKRG